MISVQGIFEVLERNQFKIVRIGAGLFAAYFFINYFLILEFATSFQADQHNSLLITFLKKVDPAILKIILSSALVIFSLTSALLIADIKTKYCAFITWVGYTFFYNYVICINQPHVSYLIFLLIVFSLFSDQTEFAQKYDFGIVSLRPRNILAGVYMTQIGISGLSKLMSPEWRAGEVLKIMSQVRDPEPGIYAFGYLPDGILMILTWSVLALEISSFTYPFLKNFRPYFLLAHIILFVGIIAFVPHAKHVAVVMILVNLLILDNKKNSELYFKGEPKLS